MKAALLVAMGAMFGVVGNLPVVLALFRGLRDGARASVGLGLAAVLFSFVLSSALLLVAHAIAEEEFPLAAIAFVAACVGLWTFCTARAWCAVNGKDATRKRGKDADGRH